jgi:hypothetical protein
LREKRVQREERVKELDVCMRVTRERDNFEFGILCTRERKLQQERPKSHALSY